MIAILDNRDSFVHNLEQLVGTFTTVTVHRDGLPEEADGIILSPGPGHPREFPAMRQVIRSATVPVLGVCLGHQALATAFGGDVGYAGEVVHGETGEVRHDDTGLFEGLPNPFPAARYHSLVVTDPPPAFEVNARGAGEIMGIRHRDRPLHGVQFHPESFLTDAGRALVRNFVELTRTHDGDVRPPAAGSVEAPEDQGGR